MYQKDKTSTVKRYDIVNDLNLRFLKIWRHVENYLNEYAFADCGIVVQLTLEARNAW